MKKESFTFLIYKKEGLSKEQLYQDVSSSVKIEIKINKIEQKSILAI